jgi:hypothetical protein
MPGRLNIAAQLITDGEIALALQMLEKETDNRQAYYWVSLLHRYEDEYDKEKKVIDKALALDSGNTYMRERLAWHNLPLFDRLVPRQPLRLPRDPKKIPSASTLDQLCFVTAGGSDTPYRECFIQLLESLRATQLYKEIPIMIMDTGLTDTDKTFIQKTFGPVTIKDPEWDVDISASVQTSGGERLTKGLKACTARPFIPKHFPGYRYYFWIDTDVWIQDERCLDLMIDQAVRQGVSATYHFSGTQSFIFSGSWWDRMTQNGEWILPEQATFLQDKKVIAGGAICIDNQTGIFKTWQQAFTADFAHSKQAWGPDELSCLYSVYKNCPKLEYLGFEQAYSMNFTGPPIVNTDGILCVPDSAKVVGLFHFCGTKKDLFFVPVIESNTGIDLQINKYGQVPRKIVALHYRTWPWQDKAEILDRLMQEAKAALEN